MALREAWDDEAEAWIRFASVKENDPAFWQFNLPAFLELLPPPGRLTIDIGCGEGRLGRELRQVGHRVLGLDTSASLVRAAAVLGPDVSVLVGDAAALPVADGVADLAVVFMVLHDVDDPQEVLEEAYRVLRRDGRLAMAIGHPLQGIGQFAGDDLSGPYVIDRPYFEPRRLIYSSERDGVLIRFNFMYQPLSAYTRALERAGFLIEALREPEPTQEMRALLPDGENRWRIPSFVHLLACKARVAL